ncbi:hypothetical protein BJ166DRAFT_145513 [Pestalotiopsis sp. NC0098]|nr:hypothetical protein BJ166DRAFT_145513 [Pestalotiopsis sp. NC0098]
MVAWSEGPLSWYVAGNIAVSCWCPLVLGSMYCKCTFYISHCVVRFVLLMQNNSSWYARLLRFGNTIRLLLTKYYNAAAEQLIGDVQALTEWLVMGLMRGASNGYH